MGEEPAPERPLHHLSVGLETGFCKAAGGGYGNVSLPLRDADLQKRPNHGSCDLKKIKRNFACEFKRAV